MKNKVLLTIIISFLPLAMFAQEKFLGFYPIKVNQYKHKLRTGLWVSYDTTYSTGYDSRGRYKKNLQSGKWKYYTEDGFIWKTEKFHKNRALVKVYYRNGNLERTGSTHCDITPKNVHWYYDGEWKFYNEDGTLNRIMYYEKGKLLKTEPVITVQAVGK